MRHGKGPSSSSPQVPVLIGEVPEVRRAAGQAACPTAHGCALCSGGRPEQGHGWIARRTGPPGAAATVATHLQVVARSAALISRGSRRASGDGGRARQGPETKDKVDKVAGMRVGVVPEPIAGTPMVVRRDGTTGTAPGGATCVTLSRTLIPPVCRPRGGDRDRGCRTPSPTARK